LQYAPSVKPIPDTQKTRRRQVDHYRRHMRHAQNLRVNLLPVSDAPRRCIARGSCLKAIRDTFSNAQKWCPETITAGNLARVERRSPSFGAFVGAICRRVFGAPKPAQRLTARCRFDSAVGSLRPTPQNHALAAIGGRHSHGLTAWGVCERQRPPVNATHASLGPRGQKWGRLLRRRGRKPCGRQLPDYGRAATAHSREHRQRSLRHRSSLIRRSLNRSFS
jgi:hypothetical protein